MFLFFNECYLAYLIAFGNDSVKEKKLIVQVFRKGHEEDLGFRHREELASDKKQGNFFLCKRREAEYGYT